MCQLFLLIKLMALIPRREILFGYIRLRHSHFMDLTLKIIFKIVWQCLVERDFSLLAGDFLDNELYGSDTGLEFRKRLWHYSDINAGSCSVWSVVYCHVSYCKGLLLRCSWVPGYILVITWCYYLIYLIKNKYSYLSRVFSEALLVEDLSHVGAMQHDFPCKSFESLVHATGFCWVVILKRQ